ncbi:MAG: SDR family oxidoreductase [Candidatus Phaeomarinobacter sp.]
MKVGLVGAHGFIGSHVARRFVQAGHEVIGFGRDVDLGSRMVPAGEWRFCDLNTDTEPGIWAERLTGCEVLINCAGVLQKTSRDDPMAIHGAATRAMFDGALQAGVRRILHVSALGADDDVDTEYSQSKRIADRYLETLDTDWVILKPSLVIARESYGGTAMVRMLAGMPGLVPVPEQANIVFQPVAMDDLTEGMLRLSAKDAPSRLTLAVTGPERKSLTDIIQIIRLWLGFAPARIIGIPTWAMQPAIWVADVLGVLGVETALRSTSFKQTEKPNVADHRPFAKATGLTMRAIPDALADNPASSADKRDARLLAPLALLRAMLAFFWIATGIITLASISSAASAMAAMALSSIIGSSAMLGLIVATSCLDVLFGLWLLAARDPLRPCLAQIAFSLGYLGGLTLLAPAMWMDPLGPLLKVLPIVAATIVLASSGARR